MLDEKKIKACLLRAQGMDVTKIAEEIGISRGTFYNWEKEDEVKAELLRLKQEFLSQGFNMVAFLAPSAVKKLAYLMVHADSSKIQLESARALLDKSISNATKISIDDTREDDTVSPDVLDNVMDQADVTE